MLKKLLKSLPFQLLLCIVFAFTVGSHLNVSFITYIYSLSCLLKEVLMFVLPFVVFSYIFAAIINLERNAPALILAILVLVTISNAIATFTAYGVGVFVLPFFNIESGSNLEINQLIFSLFNFKIPQLISSDKSMLIGIISGLFFSFYKSEAANKVACKLQKAVTFFFEKNFIPLLPIYVLGFVLKMEYEGSLSVLFTNYAQVFALICILIIVYIGLMYFIAGNFSWSEFTRFMKEMSGPGITGFSTISSAVTMPFTISATEKNIADSGFARLVIPATVNIHMIGHGLSIPITSLTILILSGQAMPSLASFAIFVLYFCLAKFSASAVPGGGIIVIVPILQSQLGFTAEMSSIIIMLDILQDAILTSANVMGNGAFAIMAHRFCNRFIARGKFASA